MAMSRFTDADPAISLFPFLSVLAGVIGTLALIIAGMMVVGLQNADQVIALAHDKTTKKTPIFVECRSDGVLLHPEGTFVPLAELAKEVSDWSKRLEEVQRRSDTAYIVLLSGRTGYESFEVCFSMAKRAELDLGYDPVYATGEIRFRSAKPENQR